MRRETLSGPFRSGPLINLGRARTEPPIEANEEGKFDLSKGLKALAEADLSHQVDFWTGAASELEGEDQGCWIRDFVLPCNDSHYDALARYFDATPSGLQYIYEKEAQENKLDRDGFFRCLVDHFGFPSDRVNSTTMKSLCEKAEEDGYISQASFAELVRKLRIGSLLISDVFLPDGPTAVYHSQHGDAHWDLKVLEWENDEGHLECLNDLVRHNFVSPAHQQDHLQLINEFMFRNPHQQSDSVQWLHVHQAHVALILALGQQYHWRLSVMGLLCRINSVPAQIDVPTERLQCTESSSWSSLVFPCVMLDKKSRSSLRRYQAWFSYQEQIAREHSPDFITRDRACKEGRKSSEEKANAKACTEQVPGSEPLIFVGVIQVTQVLLWSEDTNLGETIATSLGTPSYLGYWVAKLAATEDSPFWQRLLPCTRRNPKGGRPDSPEAHSEYQPLLQEDPEDEEKATRSLILEHATGKSFTQEQVEEMMNESSGPISLLRHQQEAEENATFEVFYDDILTQLRSPSSILRMGTHFHLMIRIILDGTTEYLDVLEVYKIVISKCKAKLSEPHYRDGPTLMVMISLSKMELSWILKSLQDFHDAVLPKLQELCAGHGKSRLSNRIIHHHMTDIHHNVGQVLREAESQMRICESMIQDYDRKTADKMNNILNILTFITSVLVPLQLLTGYYGMNFKFGLPETRAEEGVRIFWSWAFLGTITMIALMVALNRTY